MQHAPPAARPASPLVVDLDGTLLRTDTLVESALVLLRRQPWRLVQLVWWALRGPKVLKNALAERVQLPMAQLPWRPEVRSWLDAQRAAGRRVVLATAAHRRIADAAAAEVGPFEAVLATEADAAAPNLKSAAKLAAIRARFGDDFVYAGDSTADRPIWAAARAAVVVGSPALRAELEQQGRPIEAAFDDADPRPAWQVWAKALRWHQWVKNLLVFVPLFTSFRFFEAAPALASLGLFVAFGLAASATYIVNDLWDLDNDRAHRSKRARPFASGRLSPIAGLAAAAALLLAGLGLALAVNLATAAMIAGYVVLTLGYSLVLKRYVLMDVLMLGLLYTYRVLAGGVAAGIVVSPWLLAFSVFTFFSLALVKRCAELVVLQGEGRLEARGRDYRVSDLVVLWPLGVAASVSAVVVFGLYVSAPETVARFGHAQWLWLMAVGLVYWFARLWIKTSRNEMDDDPIVFALKDRGSRYVVLAMAALFAAAYLMR